MNTVTITKIEYLNLLIANAKLELLESGGVDNWEWYSESLYPDDGESLSDIRERLSLEIGT